MDRRRTEREDELAQQTSVDFFARGKEWRWWGLAGSRFAWTIASMTPPRLPPQSGLAAEHQRINRGRLPATYPTPFSCSPRRIPNTTTTTTIYPLFFYFIPARPYRHWISMSCAQWKRNFQPPQRCSVCFDLPSAEESQANSTTDISSKIKPRSHVSSKVIRCN